MIRPNPAAASAGMASGESWGETETVGERG
jgi:hypothetical protein